MPIKVHIQKLAHGQDLPLPALATPESAGYDLYAAIQNPIDLEPGTWSLIPTGFLMALALGYEAQIRPRSGLALKYGVTVLNAPGTIDSDYRGEVKVILINHGSQTFTITYGMRIAQMVFSPIQRMTWQPVEQLEPLDSARDSKGFGSTGLF